MPIASASFPEWLIPPLPQALQYFFKLLDVHHRGYLNIFDLHYFFKGVQGLMQQHKHEVVAFEDVKDEIFDMVRPADPTKLTLNDLIQWSVPPQTIYFSNITTIYFVIEQFEVELKN